MTRHWWPARVARAATRLMHSFGDRDFGGIGHRDFDKYLEAATCGPRSGTWRLGGRRESPVTTNMRRFSQHWRRHLFATDAGRKDLRAAMAQGGRLDTHSVVGYLISDAEYQRNVVEQRGSPASVRKAG
jgi:hypothetical protein